MSEQLKVSDEKAWGLGMAMLGAIPWIVNNDSDPEGPYEIWHCMGPGGKIGEFTNRSHAMSCVAIHNAGLDLLADRATLKRELEEARRPLHVKRGDQEIKVDVTRREVCDSLIGSIMEDLAAAESSRDELIKELEACMSLYREQGRVTVERDGNIAQRFGASAEIAIIKAEKARDEALRDAERLQKCVDEHKAFIGKMFDALCIDDSSDDETAIIARAAAIKSERDAAIQRAEKAKALAKRLSTAIDEARASLLASAEPFDKGCKILIDAALSPPASTPEAKANFDAEFVRLWDKHSEWSQRTFGTDAERGPSGPLKHLKKEADEALADPSDGSEFADLLLLTMDASRRSGMTLGLLLSEAWAKLEKNMLREWPKTSADEPVFHIKPVPQPAAEAVPDLSKYVGFWNGVAQHPGCWWISRHGVFSVDLDSVMLSPELHTLNELKRGIDSGQLVPNQWPIPESAQREIDRIKQGKDGE